MNETTIIKFEPALPCAIRNPDGESGECGKPTTAGYVQKMGGPYPFYSLQPICAECAKKAAAIYAKLEERLTDDHERGTLSP